MKKGNMTTKLLVTLATRQAFGKLLGHNLCINRQLASHVPEFEPRSANILQLNVVTYRL